MPRWRAGKTVGILVRQTFATILSALILLGAQTQVQAEDTSAGSDGINDKRTIAQAGDTLNAQVTYSEVSLLTKNILLKEIELEKLNTEFRITSLHNDKWRGWRQLSYSLGNACSTESGLITAMVLRYKYLRVPPLLAKKKTEKIKVDGKEKDKDEIVFQRASRNPINRHSLEGSVIPQLVGNCIGTIGPSIELGVNLAKYRRERRQGMTPSMVRKRVLALRGEIDDLLSERTKAVQSDTTSSPENIALYSSEGKILQDIRDLANLQSERYYINAKQFSAFQLSAYSIDWLRNILGGTGGILSLNTIGARHPHEGGAAALFTTLSGVAALAIPTGSTISSYLAGRIARSHFSDLNGVGKIPQFERAKVRVYEGDVDKLVKLAAASESRTKWTDLDHRLFAYVNQSAIYDGQENLMVQQVRQDLDTTLQTFMVAGMGGSTKIANGVTNMIAGWHYFAKPVVSSSLAAAGVTTYASGTGAQILETIREKAMQQKTEHKLKKQGLLPSQLREQRLKVLAEMKTIVDR